MRLVGLFLALGIIAMMGVMLTTMSANASAQLSSASKASWLGTNEVGVTILTSEQRPSVASQAAQSTSRASPPESSRKNAKKRFGNRCARITTTCWGAA